MTDREAAVSACPTRILRTATIDAVIGKGNLIRNNGESSRCVARKKHIGGTVKNLNCIAAYADAVLNNVVAITFSSSQQSTRIWIVIGVDISLGHVSLYAESYLLD